MAPLPPSKNPKARARHRRWAANPAVRKRLKESQRRYRAKNRDKVNAYDRKRRDQDRAGYNEYQCLLRYGLTRDEFRAMAAGQEGKCAICKFPSKLHVDHNHETKRVRGLLCVRCNIGLGNFKDRIDLLTAAINYLAGRK